MNSAKAFCFQELSSICSRNESDFSDFGTVVTQGKLEGSTYTYKDNNSSVLGVAHLDTVQNGNWASIIRTKKKEKVILSPQLDDRLGVYIITRLLPRLGVHCDWLLTTGEEIGCSSAELFKTDKSYNWAFSFDRAGTDVVLYQHDHKALRKVLRKAGFRVGEGSFSDLSSLEIGCSGINFGCGYQNCHSIDAYALLSDTLEMVTKFARFHEKFQDVKLPYDPRPAWQSWNYGTWRPNRHSYSEYGYGHNYGSLRGKKQDPYLDWYEVEICDYCGKTDGSTQREGIAFVCDDCRTYMEEAINGSNGHTQYEGNGI